SNFANKIWNASRFVLMNIEENKDYDKIFDSSSEALTTADYWTLSKLNKLKKEVTENMEKFELGIAAQKIYDFIWFEFCDWYIELVKPRLYSEDDDSKSIAQATLICVLRDSIKLLHPFMPFITEEIYLHLPQTYESIVISQWPQYDEAFDASSQESNMEIIMEAIKGIRNIRAEMNVLPSRKSKTIIVSDREEVINAMVEGTPYIKKLAYSSEVIVKTSKEDISDGAVSIIIEGAEIFLPLEDLIDIEKEIERLSKEKEKLQKELDRVKSKLSNERFLSKAPAAVIEEEKDKEKKYKELMEKVLDRLKGLK
ncbi:MAG: class I tRNA ligase family protein, partial [Lutispora sp.]|nr:class I tRNA ligase family protein [Lutispora sp.]